jgi:hypothetical protein
MLIGFEHYDLETGVTTVTLVAASTEDQAVADARTLLGHLPLVIWRLDGAVRKPVDLSRYDSQTT